MDNQEAIKMLTAKVECIRRETSGTDIDCNLRNCDDCELCYAQGTTGEQRKALNMAISALQEQDVPDTNVGGMINRQAAIDILNQYALSLNPDKDSKELWKVKSIKSFIEQLPSAQPDTKEQLSREDTTFDLISRQDAIDAVGNMLRRKFGIGGDLAEITLACLPSAQPLVKDSPSLVKDLVKDCISRQKAIDRINKQREHLQPDIYPQDKIGDAAYRICAEFIERLPSAQPEPHYCRECKWSRCHINVDKYGNTETYWHCRNWDGGTDEEGYCYEWERKTDEGD